MTAVKWQTFSPGFKLLFLTLLILLCLLMGGLLMQVLGTWYLGADGYSPEAVMEDAVLFKWFQVLQTFMLFIIPSYLAAFLFYPGSMRPFYGEGRVGISLLLLSGLIIFISQNFIGWSGYLNYQIQLPESWSVISQWIEETEKEMMDVTLMMAQSETRLGFLANVVVLAVLPAIGEEWLFRGHIQKYLGDWMKNTHLAILITAFLFSAMHFQFLSFLPRFFLGIILGYLFYWGKNLWLPVMGHFVNNFMALLLFELTQETDSGANPFEMGAEAPFYGTVILSFVGTFGLLYLLKRVRLVMD